jgi:hypothetical protein
MIVVVKYQSHGAWGFHNIVFISLEKFYDFVRFRLANSVVLERLTCVIDTDIPFSFGNAKASVSSLHVAPNVEARSACQLANLIDQQLPCSLLRIVAAGRKTAESRIAPQHPIHVIDERGYYVISPEPLDSEELPFVFVVILILME